MGSFKRDLVHTAAGRRSRKGYMLVFGCLSVKGAASLPSSQFRTPSCASRGSHFAARSLTYFKASSLDPVSPLTTKNVAPARPPNSTALSWAPRWRRSRRSAARSPRSAARSARRPPSEFSYLASLCAGSAVTSHEADCAEGVFVILLWPHPLACCWEFLSNQWWYLDGGGRK